MGFNKQVFAANVRAARAAMDLSQEEFAKAVGVSKAALAAYEDGEGYTPRADKVMAICRFTGKSPNELMGWKEAV